MNNKTAYEILGISENDSVDQIKRQYRLLAMKLHPDRGGNAEEFQLLKDAYQTVMSTVNTEKQVRSFDLSSDIFFKKMFGNKDGPWR